MKAPKILLYSLFGGGKTSFVATGGKEVQIIDLDDGLQSPQTLQDKWTEKRRACVENALPCHETNPRKALAFNKARSYIQSIFEQCDKNTYPFKVLVIDSLTTLSEFAMRSILDANAMLGKQPRLQHWGIRDIMFKELLIALKALPICVIVLAHQQGEGEAVDNPITPAIAGKSLPPLLHSQFDEILHARARTVAKGKTEYVVENQSSSNITVRTRYNCPNFFDMNRGLQEFLGEMGYEINS